jgi:hypothetical protein
VFTRPKLGPESPASRRAYESVDIRVACGQRFQLAAAVLLEVPEEVPDAEEDDDDLDDLDDLDDPDDPDDLDDPDDPDDSDDLDDLDDSDDSDDLDDLDESDDLDDPDDEEDFTAGLSDESGLPFDSPEPFPAARLSVR